MSIDAKAEGGAVGAGVGVGVVVGVGVGVGVAIDALRYSLNSSNVLKGIVEFS
jgi:hypothetical protein